MVTASDEDASNLGLFSLPNELLIHILLPLPTQLLLPLTTVSHRFFDLIHRVIHGRLLLAETLLDPSNLNLILECYHPSARSTEPYLYCDYLGTPGLGNAIEDDAVGITGSGKAHSPPRLQRLYSCFRPVPDVDERIYRPHPAGDVPGRSSSSVASPRGNIPTNGVTDLVTHHITLESFEPFSQLHVQSALVKQGPRRGVFHNYIHIKDGIVRIFRDWLMERARAAGGDSAKETRLRSIEKTEPDARILWLNDARNVGLRVRVKERRWRQGMPILFHKDESIGASYSIEYEELLIRTSYLLLAVERDANEKGSDSGKAMIFGSFAIRNSSLENEGMETSGLG
ncbi:hypothetical protein MMC20_001920 [Loxospora ochrophaea]|nr:hypothetical protein [Loxospora ochrophaea]